MIVPENTYVESRGVPYSYSLCLCQQIHVNQACTQAVRYAKHSLSVPLHVSRKQLATSLRMIS